MGKAEKKKENIILVECGDCKHFVRDTDGPNRNIYTGEYFMGVSDIGCDPDKTFYIKTGKAKIFADKKRVCRSWRKKTK